jgi:two-component system, chemotaxis family, response regulator Rcp1
MFAHLMEARAMAMELAPIGRDVHVHGWRGIGLGISHAGRAVVDSGNPQPNILLVEDNPADVRLTLEALRDAGEAFQLHVARDGEEAMTFVRREGEFANRPAPDLIVLDLNLPRKDGREVLAELKMDPELHRIPVVVLSSSAAASDVIHAYDLGANCYVTKPRGFEAFVQAVRAIQQFWLGCVRLPSRLDADPP